MLHARQKLNQPISAAQPAGQSLVVIGEDVVNEKVESHRGDNSDFPGLQEH
jgi:hypothetical protein